MSKSFLNHYGPPSSGKRHQYIIWTWIGIASITLVLFCACGGMKHYPYDYGVDKSAFLEVHPPYSPQCQLAIDKAIGAWLSEGIDTTKFDLYVEEDTLAYLIHLTSKLDPMVKPPDTTTFGVYSLLPELMMALRKLDLEIIGNYATHASQLRRGRS